MTITASLATAFVLTLPMGSTVHVDLTQKLPNNYAGFVSYRSPDHITLRSDLEWNEATRDLIAHEFCHTLDFKAGKAYSNQHPFGKGEFVSNYSRKSKEEDWAEVCMYVIRDKNIPKGDLLAKKVQIVQSILYPPKL